MRELHHGGASRRRFLRDSGGMAALGAAGLLPWVPAGVVHAAAAGLPLPPGFPSFASGTAPYLQQYRNWAGVVVADGVWSCAPRSTEEIVALCNWARSVGWKIRARGLMRCWAPFNVANGANSPALLMLDMSQFMTAIQVQPAGANVGSVTVQAGATMDAIMLEAEKYGLAFASMPGPGSLTIGGVLAIDGHGTGVLAQGESRRRGWTTGSLSNAILSLTAIVHDPARNAYVARTFARNDPAIAPLLTSLGRTVITQVTLQMGQGTPLQCLSTMGISTAELFARPGSWGRTFQSLMESTGRVEAIWYPYTAFPWVKTWKLAPSKPWTSRWTSGAYNYPFSDTITPEFSNTLSQIMQGAPALTPGLGGTAASTTALGLPAYGAVDLWGPARHVQHYIRPSTLRVTASGYAVIVRRADVQRVVWEFSNQYQSLLGAYALRGLYPVNAAVEIRVTGLDQPSDVAMAGAVAPTLSALAPIADRPELDTAVWINVLTFPGTPGSDAFYRDMEQWMVGNYMSYGRLRVEWAKGWAYGSGGAWTDDAVLGGGLSWVMRSQSGVDAWGNASAALKAMDPANLFSAPLLDRMLG